MKLNSTFLGLVSWVFAILFLAIGLLNCFWGNDPFYGLMVVMLSVAFIPPTDTLLKAKTCHTIPRLAKIFLGAFILWTALGVGELFIKFDMMMTDLTGAS